MKSLKWDDIEEDVLSFGGLLLAGVGAGIIYLPAGFIVVGVGMMGIGLSWFIKLPPQSFTEEQTAKIERIEKEKEI